MTTFYLSSTFEDLKECREAVCKVLRQMDHQVEGMESYTADGRAPLEKCLADVARCDVYVGIFARRYGYVPGKNNPRQLSITELEYRTAVERKKKVLIFILDKNAMWRDEDEGDEQRKRLRSLREELAKEHIVSFFHDRHELASQVSVAVASLLKKDEQPNGHQPEPKLEPEPELEPGPPPQPPPPRPWKWYALAAIAAAILGTGIFYQLKFWYWPDEYPKRKEYDFFLTEREQLEELWHLPPGNWNLERGEGRLINDGALLIKGNRMAAPKDLGGKVFYDYQAEFKVRFKAGESAAWILRAQRDRQSGYLFELVKEGGSLFLRGRIVKGDRVVGDLAPGRVFLGFSTCCNQTDGLHVYVNVVGDQFDYCFNFESDRGHATDDTGTNRKAAFVDSDSTFRWGTMGLLVTGDATPPREGPADEIKVEFLYLTPLTAGSASDRSSQCD